MAWVWIAHEVVLAIHDEQLAEHGGGTGMRDMGLLESALARPLNIEAYNPEADVADLAAAYAFGITRNHPFVDGNKRTGFVVMELFLALNGATLTADDASCVATMMGLAAGDVDDEALTRWVRGHIALSEPGP